MHECEICGIITPATIRCCECGTSLCEDCFDKTFDEASCLLCERVSRELELVAR